MSRTATLSGRTGRGLDPSELFSVAGRLVVITGGLGQLGRQFTNTLVERGARVAIFDRAADDGGARDSQSVMVLATDVTDRSSLEQSLARVESRWGPPRGLINAAALDAPPNSTTRENCAFEDYPADSWRTVMDVNVTGVFLASQVVGARMARAEGGSIVNISSIYGLVSPDQRVYEFRRTEAAPFFKPAAYSTSKSALFNLTRYMATYWADKRVRVNTLTLGGVFDDQDPRFVAEYSRRTPMGRMAKEHEYNAAIVFLLSEASSYMTGSNVVMDGGWTAW